MALKKCGLFHIRSAVSLTMAGGRRRRRPRLGKKTGRRGEGVGEAYRRKNPSRLSSGSGARWKLCAVASRSRMCRWAGIWSGPKLAISHDTTIFSLSFSFKLKLCIPFPILTTPSIIRYFDHIKEYVYLISNKQT